MCKYLYGENSCMVGLWFLLVVTGGGVRALCVCVCVCACVRACVCVCLHESCLLHHTR